MLEIQRSIGQYEYAKLTTDEQNPQLNDIIGNFEGLVSRLRGRAESASNAELSPSGVKCLHKPLKERGKYEYCLSCGSRREIFPDGLRGVWQIMIEKEK
jgi:hypothetical protein